MKSNLLILAILTPILIFTQCKKSETTPEKQTSITYPVTGIFGNNILNMADSTVINPQLEFSFAANLQTDATLKIIMTNLSSSSKASWFFISASNQNWNISDYDTTLNQQTFSSNKGSSLDLSMVFSDVSGECKIDFYENNSQSPTKSRYLKWQVFKK
ncbi:MAG: hypothetical protein M0P47_08835 [Bacteroidales bacterium]|nr:hypothetical protein [Bacteroidales bacterium]